MNRNDSPETMRGKRIGPNLDLGPKHPGPKYESNQQQNRQKEKK